MQKATQKKKGVNAYRKATFSGERTCVRWAQLDSFRRHSDWDWNLETFVNSYYNKFNYAL